jgi:L-alanine-DL-glutamate epimerase-like enolase superfamily enzyme
MKKFTSSFPTVDADGYAALPTGPGLGVEIDEDFMNKNPPQAWIPESFREDGTIHEW